MIGIYEVTTEGAKCERGEGKEESLEERLHLEDKSPQRKRTHSCYCFLIVGDAPLGQALDRPASPSKWIVFDFLSIQHSLQGFVPGM